MFLVVFNESIIGTQFQQNPTSKSSLTISQQTLNRTCFLELEFCSCYAWVFAEFRTWLLFLKQE